MEKTSRLYEQVEEGLAKDIAQGVFVAGQALPPERELIARFGVGRPSIREALFSLGNRGLITLRKGRRPVVCSPDVELALQQFEATALRTLGNVRSRQQLMDIKRVFECAIVRHAAKVASAQNIEVLQRLMRIGKENHQDTASMKQADRLFHSTLQSICFNPLPVAAVQIMNQWLERIRSSTTLSMTDQRDNLLLHKAIVDGIADRDPEAAEKALLKHWQHEVNGLDYGRSAQSLIQDDPPDRPRFAR